MRIHSFFLTTVFISVLIFSAGCNGSSPVLVIDSAAIQYQAAFSSRMLARFNPSTGMVWFTAPPGMIMPNTAVNIIFPGHPLRRLHSNPDGSFLLEFPGDDGSNFNIEWFDNSGIKNSDEINVTNPANDLVTQIHETGLYCNRMYVDENYVWVINSGDDALVSHDRDSIENLPTVINTPAFSNPWEAAFYSQSGGLITTLFEGVFWFDANTSTVNEIDATGFRPFGSPNGVAISGNRGWVTNTNPISYFPTSHGPGWLSEIDINSRKVVSEIDTPWLNPQYVITDDNFIYISCSGTVDFVPPDYIATAFSNGGILVIDPSTGNIIQAYDLGLAAPGPMAFSPDRRYLYCGSGVYAYLFRIDLENENILNDLTNPIVISDLEGSYVPFVEINENGLLATASFNDDVIRFVDSRTGQVDPYPFFKPLQLHPYDFDLLWGPQDGVFMERNGKYGFLFMTTVNGAFHWIEI